MPTGAASLDTDTASGSYAGGKRRPTQEPGTLRRDPDMAFASYHAAARMAERLRLRLQRLLPRHCLRIRDVCNGNRIG